MAKRCRESGPSSSAAAGRGAVRAAAAAKTTPAALPNGDANPTAHGLPSPSPRSSFLPRLPSDLINSVLALLSPNDLACNGRLAFKDAAQRFRLPRHRTVALGQTMSDHTAQQWQQHAAPRLKHLTLGAKLQLLSTAAATGCTANLSAVWALLRPCLFPELLPTKHALSYHYVPHYLGDDPGTAAVAAGHVQVRKGGCSRGSRGGVAWVTVGERAGGLGRDWGRRFGVGTGAGSTRGWVDAQEMSMEMQGSGGGWAAAGFRQRPLT